jgi:hypothetical protein
MFNIRLVCVIILNIKALILITYSFSTEMEIMREAGRRHSLISRPILFLTTLFTVSYDGVTTVPSNGTYKNEFLNVH